jgi:hypothetical protein
MIGRTFWKVGEWSASASSPKCISLDPTVLWVVGEWYAPADPHNRKKD